MVLMGIFLMILSVEFFFFALHMLINLGTIGILTTCFLLHDQNTVFFYLYL